MRFELGSRTRFAFLAGQERGIRIAYMARALWADPVLRSKLVEHARKANSNMVAYLRAAKEAM